MKDVITRAQNLREENRKKRATVDGIAALTEAARADAIIRDEQRQEWHQKSQAGASGASTALHAGSQSAPVQKLMMATSLKDVEKLFDHDESDLLHNSMMSLVNALDEIEDAQIRQVFKRAILDSEDDIRQSVAAIQTLIMRGPVDVVVMEEASAPENMAQEVSTALELRQSKGAHAGTAPALVAAPAATQKVLETFHIKGKGGVNHYEPAAQLTFVVKEGDSLTKTALDLSQSGEQKWCALSVCRAINDRLEVEDYCHKETILKLSAAVSDVSLKLADILRRSGQLSDTTSIANNPHSFVAAMRGVSLALTATRKAPVGDAHLTLT